MKKGYWKLMLPVVIALVWVLGFGMGKFLVPNNAPLTNKSINSSKNFNFLSELINYIDAQYVDSVSKDQLVNSTITSLLHELDPHSYYITPEEISAMNEPLEGGFDGIGVQFNIQKDTLVVIDPIVGGPSEKVGVKAGDRVIAVNDSTIAGVGIQNSQVLKLLKGPKGTKVAITVYRKGEVLDFTITRDQIPIHSVSGSYMVNPTIGYVKVDRFGKNTNSEFYLALKTLAQKGMKRVIVDLRGNGGGYMNAATDMLDLFFEKGTLLVYTQGKARPKQESLARKNAEFSDLDVVVLIDETSASASEIFAGAIQDHDRGVIVGRRSFGKGLVQEQTMWPNGAATRLTIARYYTPSGRCIQKPYENGIEDYNEDYYHRMQNGELLSKDSIHLQDSAVFYTDNGRVVYGSGGIIPDEFIPVDTTGGSLFLNNLVYQGVIYDFAFDYVDLHRAELLKIGDAQAFVQKFTINEELFNHFLEFAKKKNVVPTGNDLERSKKSIKRRLLAYIGRNLWQDEGFYPIWNQDDPVMKAAIQVDMNVVNMGK